MAYRTRHGAILYYTLLRVAEVRGGEPTLRAGGQEQARL
jgi:hypothetical protein